MVAALSLLLLFPLYRKTTGFITCLLLLSFVTTAQDTALFQRHLFIQKGDTLPYRILLPENYDAGRQYPLLFFLHGRGESGTDNNKQLTHGARLFIDPDNRKRFPAIIVFPQCPANSYWSNVRITTDTAGKRHFRFRKAGAPTSAMKMADRLLHQLLATYPVKKDQVYVGGLSMGGMGVFEIARRNPDLFAAAFAICGGAHPATASKLRQPYWWIFHGGRDDVVDPDFSEKMVEALKEKGADVRFTLYPEANHNSWDRSFAEPGLLPWLFSKTKR